MFFDGTDRVHQAMRRVTQLFDQHGIAYAVAGGMAVNAHHHSRTTADVDFLIRADAMPMLRKLAAEGKFNSTPGHPRRFVEPATGVRFDVLVAGLFPGSGRPGPIPFPDPLAVSEVIDDFRVIDLRTLVELKLAAHRYQDFADVVSLIRANDLDERFGQTLHVSVRGDFNECLEERKREDEYERRQDSDVK